MARGAERAVPVGGLDTTMPGPTPSDPIQVRSLSPTPDGLDLEQALEREEHIANTLRLRKALVAGGALWPAFLVVDLAMVRFVTPQPFLRFLVVRLVLWAVLLGSVWLLGRKPGPSPRILLLIDIACFGGTCAAIAVLCTWLGGLISPYAGGVTVVLVCRASFMADRWRRALWSAGIGAASYPLIVIGGAILQGSDQLTDPAALTLFGLYDALILSTLAFLLFGGQAVWALRRQVFEARGIGRYRLERRIGRGGMGEVWIAHHGGLKRNVAMKILRPERSRDPAMVRRFEREVQATTELNHPNTVRVFDYGVTEDGVWYYVMELLEGEDLARLVSLRGHLPPRRAANIVLQASRALAEAHDRGIIHRDIKPANVFITSGGDDRDFVKVLDFGIAKLTNEQLDATLTQTGWIGGTPAFMSPEAARGEETSPRADVYGLGAVLYFAVAGRPPYKSDALHQLVSAQLAGPPLRPSEHRDDSIPASLETIIMRCLDPDPAARFAHAGELVSALDGWLSTSGDSLDRES